MEKGGWIPVLNQRGSKGGWRKEATAKLFTIFVDDLPRSMNLKMLGEIFRKFGVVKDVYIPLKRRRVRNTRFAFVRYDCEVAAEVAVQKANGIWVDDKQLVVKHADYGKNDMEVKIRYPPQTKGFPHGGRGEGSVWKPAAGVRTYAEVIKNSHGMGSGIVSVQAEEVGNGWLYETVVVRLKVEYANVKIKYELQQRGMENVVVRDGGGRDVLLTFNSKECMKDSLGTVKEWIGDWCDEIVRWNPDVHSGGERKVWVCCFGIPWSLWNRTTLNRIGKVWGEVICIEGDICNPESFEYARIQILTKCMEPINTIINLECKGYSQTVRVWEHLSGAPQILAGRSESSMVQGGVGACSSNKGVKVGVAVMATDVAVEDDDWVGESARELDQLKEVCIGVGPGRVRCSDEVQMGSPRQSETVVPESTGSELEGIADSIMEVAGSIGNGCELEGQKSKEQVGMKGAVKSLSGSSLLKPGVHLEVVLGRNNGMGLCNGPVVMRAGGETQTQGSKAGLQSGLQVEKSPLIICSDIPESQCNELSSRKKLQKNRGMKRVVTKSSGKKIREMKQGYLKRPKSHNHRGASSSKLGPRGAIWRAAAAVASGVDSTASGVARSRSLLKEAQGTIQMGKLLGINYKGKEEEVLTKILDLEANDRARRGGNVVLVD
ncbi:uncharacterized protein LOC114263027 [Camellia sinensis]|uniref:uncharacterized protein LOC114263027 n=1 Tax=Camellia sinensis TaxID=4442 RepID=UPI00103693FA|nr:uncharacterized protein LOC114263027 [Camellia sinensis]